MNRADFTCVYWVCVALCVAWHRTLCARVESSSMVACRSIKDSIEMACGQLSEASLRREGASAETPNVAVYLPRNTLISSLEDCLQVRGYHLQALCVERNVLNGQLKAVTLYMRCSTTTHSVGEAGDI